MRNAIRRSAPLLAVVLAPSALAAQATWFDPGPASGAAIEIFKPDLEGDDDLSLATSATFVSVRARISDNLRVVGELPFAYVGADGDSESAIGNPYIGLRSYRSDGLVSIDLGVRPPLTPDDEFAAVVVGAFADLDRMEAFLPHVFTLSVGVNYHRRTERGFAFRFHASPIGLIGTGDNEDNELVVGYGGELWYELPQVRVGGGLAGRWLASGDGSLGEETFHQLGIGADFGAGQFRPGVQLRVPLDEDMQSIHDLVFGLSLQVRRR